MSKQVRLSGDVAARVDLRALVERRSFANMVEVLLLSALESGSPLPAAAVLAERGGRAGRSQSPAPAEREGDVTGLDVEAVPGGASPVPRSVSVAAVPRLVQNQPMEKMARDLAVVGGKCAADVARGTKCKLCGKVHG